MKVGDKLLWTLLLAVAFYATAFISYGIGFSRGKDAKTCERIDCMQYYTQGYFACKEEYKPLKRR